MFSETASVLDGATLRDVNTVGTAELVGRAATGDEPAWRALVDRYTRLVWHVIHGFGLPGDTAADVHQATWLRLAENIDRVHTPDALGSWLATTARRECIRVSKQSEREIPSEMDLDAIVVDEPLEQHLLETERDAGLWQAFATLPRHCQQLLRLLIAEPAFTYDEISAILDMPKGSIGPTRARCLERLRTDPRVGFREGSS